MGDWSGPASEGATGAPTIVGGEYITPVPTLSNGQLSPLLLGSNGQLLATLTTGTSPLTTSGTNADGSAPSGSPSLRVVADLYLFNGSSFDRQRTPAVFKTATINTTGDNAVWTPASGKKFRLMGYEIVATANCAISGGATVVEAVFRDGTSPIGIGQSVFVPATAITAFGPLDRLSHDIGNGYLSAAANNVLNLNLSATLTSGEMRVNVYGTEE